MFRDFFILKFLVMVKIKFMSDKNIFAIFQLVFINSTNFWKKMHGSDQQAFWRKTSRILQDVLQFN